MNTTPAVDLDYAEHEVVGEDVEELVLTPKMPEAATRWRKRVSIWELRPPDVRIQAQCNRLHF